MSTFTDTTVSISLATPEDIRDLSQKTFHLWVGATSPLWAPFWAAASFGVSLWALGQGTAKTLGGTLYDRDVSLALKWPGFEALPKPVESLAVVAEKTADTAEEVVATTTDALEDTGAVVAEAAEVAGTTVADAVETVSETIEDTAEAARTVTVEATETTAEATLDLLEPPVAPAKDTLPLIDPVTEKPVIPAVAEATAEPKLPMPKPAPRRPRKG